MDIIFNELSAYHKQSDEYAANSIMVQLIKTCKESMGFDFTRMRVRHDFELLILTENYRILDWLNNSKVNRIYKDFLLSIKRYPYIEDGDEAMENQFISNYYYFNENDNSGLNRKEVEGLAVAFLLNTLSISFASHRIWEKTEIELIETSEDAEKTVNVRHISKDRNLEVHREWLEENRPILLIESDILPEIKKIKLRDDHGKDILREFAVKLNNSPYIIETLNSLPFNPKDQNFIKRCYPDGKIEVVLTWTDEGFGIIIQTTGRNLQETKYIADILNENYGKR